MVEWDFMMVDRDVCSPDLVHFLEMPVYPIFSFELGALFGLDSQISCVVLFIKIGT